MMGSFSCLCRSPRLHHRVTVRVADLVTPPLVPEIVTLVVLRTRFVVTGKVATVAPAATLTLDGTVATVVLLLESWMVIPVGGAVPLRVTVPVDVLPPTTFDGFNFNEESVGGVIVNAAIFVMPLNAADMLATVEDATAVVPMLKLTVVAPCGTVTDGDTVADALSLERVTTRLAVAAAVSVTVPVDEFPPTTLVGFTESEDSATVEVELKFALTDFAASMVTLHAPVPLHAPLQPANVEPESGVAVKLTTVPLAKFAEHVVPQEIPAGELATVPVPVPLFVSVRVKEVEAAPLINLLRTFVVAC
jgi:hypothetical protein